MRKALVIITIMFVALPMFVFAFNTESVREQSGLITLDYEDFGFKSGKPGSHELARTKDGDYIIRFVSTNRFDSGYITIPLGKKEEAINNMEDLMYIAQNKNYEEIVWITDKISVYKTYNGFGEQMVFKSEGYTG